IGSTTNDKTRKLMTMGRFLKKYIMNTSAEAPKAHIYKYNIFDFVPALWHTFPTFKFAMGEFNDYSEDDDDGTFQVSPDTYLNMGPSGIISPLHSTYRKRIFCQIAGRRYVRLYDQRNAKYLAPEVVESKKWGTRCSKII